MMGKPIFFKKGLTSGRVVAGQNDLGNSKSLVGIALYLQYW